MGKEESKQVLIEELGIDLESEHNLPPLAARVFAILILTDQDGLTFEDCLIKRGASKSSISTSLNLLQQLGFINYFTKAGDRKRYFKVAEKDTFFLKKLNLSLTKIEKESEIIDKVSAYNKKFNPEKFHTNEDKREVYTKCLNDMTKTLQSTITKLKELQV